MHNIFEGLVEYHICDVLGIDDPDLEPGVEKVADPRQLASATKLFKWGHPHPTRQTLERFTIAVLKALCSDNHLALPVVEKGKSTRKAPFLDILETFLVNIFKRQVCIFLTVCYGTSEITTK